MRTIEAFRQGPDGHDIRAKDFVAIKQSGKETRGRVTGVGAVNGEVVNISIMDKAGNMHSFRKIPGDPIIVTLIPPDENV